MKATTIVIIFIAGISLGKCILLGSNFFNIIITMLLSTYICYSILGQALKCWVGDRFPYQSEDCNSSDDEDVACLKVINGRVLFS